jgi:hypothetical protein
MVADRVKAKGGALRDRKTLRLDNGRRHGVCCMYVYVLCVIIGRMQHHSTM